MKKLLYALTAFGMVACGKGGNDIPANQLAGNDFESLDGWIGDQPVPSLTKEKAHSGRYSVKVDPTIEYSMGFNMLLGKLSSSKLKKMKVKGWAYLPSGRAGAVLVMNISDPTNPGAQPLKWEGLDLVKEVKNYNKWVEIEHVVDVPEAATYNSKFSMYLWRTNTNEPVYIDDLVVERVDG